MSIHFKSIFQYDQHATVFAIVITIYYVKTHRLSELHPHKLRHSFASMAITNGADIASVSEILGHSDKAVTLRMYTHADQASMTRASNIFREAIKRKQA